MPALALFKQLSNGVRSRWAVAPTGTQSTEGTKQNHQYQSAMQRLSPRYEANPAMPLLATAEKVMRTHRTAGKVF